MKFDYENIKTRSENWIGASPFPNFTVDNFFNYEWAKNLEEEFPDFESPVWHEYGNAVEVKKVSNNWNVMPPVTYKTFQFLNSESFVNNLSSILFGSKILIPDPGLNGGGWHIHKSGGKLNTHLDYSIHPKLKLQRKVNIIIYLNSNWDPSWGGSLGLWGNQDPEKPGRLEKEITPLFNRAAIFDTTCNSWHGLPKPLTCPASEFRKSIAVYYLIEPKGNVNPRGKALFAPYEDQVNAPEVLALIEKRSRTDTAATVYKKE